MSRRDTIIIAVLMNTGLLAILFLMAVTSDDETLQVPVPPPPAVAQIEDIQQYVAIAPPQPRPPQQPEIVTIQAPSTPAPIVIPDETDHLLAQQEVKPTPVEVPKPKVHQDEIQYVEVTVKRGDSLSTIAYANGTSVAAIKKANRLQSERIDIGQVLMVPLNYPPKKIATEQPSGPEYYTIQPGDNPWKLAKRFHVKFDELLRMNHLDESRARNLKPGDKIRVR